MIRLLGDESAGDVTVLRFAGEIDECSVSSLRSLLQCKARTKCPVLLLDFADVTYVNSRGMAALIEYWRESRNFGGFFGIVGLNENLQEIFHIVHLDDSLRLFPTMDSALEAMASASIPSAGSIRSIRSIRSMEGTGEVAPEGRHEAAGARVLAD
jgi:anti-sigma B factor antagonist